MNTYRHKNGGGLKVYPAQACPDSTLDELSTIEGESEVYFSVLNDSSLRDAFVARYSVVRRSVVTDSRVVSSAVENSDVTASTVYVASVEACRLTGCRVHGKDDAEPLLVGVSLEGVHVSGDVQLYGPWGLSLEGAHIHAGVWEEQPRHTLIEGEGVHVAVVECTMGRAHMGCACRSVPHWLQKGPRLARRLGWGEEQIETCLNFLKSL